MKRNTSVSTTAGTTAGLPRSAEVLLALTGLITLLPVFIILAILIKFTNRGPILFRQQRVGAGGRKFTLLKFRTMRVNQPGPLITAATDKRVTRLGKLLRRTKLDELPELINILKGDMSFVGPRPEVPELVDINDPLWQEILIARPGITDPVTIRLRNEEDLLAGVVNKEAYYREILQPFKLKGYVNFLRKRGWKTDIRIILRTIKVTLLPNILPPPSREEIQTVLLD